MSHSITKPTKWPVRPAKTPTSLGIHSVCRPSLIRVFAVRMKTAWVLSYPLSAQRKLCSDWADAQADPTGRMPRLIWVFAGRTDHFVGFVVLRLKWGTTYRHSNKSHYSESLRINKTEKYWIRWADEASLTQMMRSDKWHTRVRFGNHLTDDQSQLLDNDRYK